MGANTLTPARWETVRGVLLGECTEGISMRLAAKKAGVHPRDIHAWVRRSRERRDEDEPWVWDIAVEYDSRLEEQGASLEDRAWQKAHGHDEEKVDTKTLLRLLEAKNSDYSRRTDITIRNLADDPSEVAQRMMAILRKQRANLARLELPPAAKVIAVDADVVDGEGSLDG